MERESESELDDGRPAIEMFKIKPGTWLAGMWYVAAVIESEATLLTQSTIHTREEIEREGQRVKEKLERAAKLHRAHRRKLAGRIDKRD